MYLDENSCHFSVLKGTLTFTSPYFGTVARLSPWEQPCKILRYHSLWGDDLLEADFPLFTADILQHMPEHPVSRYAATLPPAVVAGLVPYEVDQLSMLQVCAASPSGADLLHYAPNVLWLTAPDILRVSGGACDRIHKMLGRSHEYLLQLMEPAPPAVVLELLGRLPPPQILDDARALLWRMLGNVDCCDIMRRRKHTSWEMLKVLERYAALLDIKAVRNVALRSSGTLQLRDELECIFRFREEIVRLGHKLYIRNAHDRLSQCSSIDDVKALRNLWAERLQAVHDEEELKGLRFLVQPFS